MVEKIKITKWVYRFSLVLFFVTLLSLFTEFTKFGYNFLYLASWLVLYCVYLSPIMIFLVFIDWIFRHDSSSKKGIIAVIINVLILIVVVYYGNHLFDNFMSLS